MKKIILGLVLFICASTNNFALEKSNTKEQVFYCFDPTTKFLQAWTRNEEEIATKILKTQNPDWCGAVFNLEQTQILEIPETEIHAQMSMPLFEWVIENLCKNAVDAMDGKGEFKVTIIDIPEGVAIDLADTGKGIPKSKHKSVFKPGYTTKKRGWGLGLSLCKRIIENYHDGKIFVLQSEEGKGTTFRILLKRG